MAEAGLSPDGLSVLVDDGVDSGRAAASGLFASAEPPSAFVCASDSLALGVQDAVRGSSATTPCRSSASTTPRWQRPSGSARSASR